MSEEMIVYKDSPFLPPTNEQSVRRIRNGALIHKYPFTMAISLELFEISIDTYDLLYHVSMRWIFDAFHCTHKDIDQFMLGFSIPPSLIIASTLMHSLPFSEVIPSMCPPTNDPILLGANQYKSNNLLECFTLFSAHDPLPPQKRGLAIYQFCKQHPYSTNRFYLAGMEASEINYLTYANLFFPVE